MQLKTKVCIIATVAAICSLAFLSMATAAGSVTLTPKAQAPGGSVNVSGSGFGSTKTVTIGLGAEVAGNEASMAYSGTGMGPYSGRTANWPIKPGSFSLTADTTMSGGIVTTFTDNGDGTLRPSGGNGVGTINYATGQWSRTSGQADLTGLASSTARLTLGMHIT